MSADFTLKKYSELLRAFGDECYQFITFEQYCSNNSTFSDKKYVILRHDVDLKADNSLVVARIEHDFNIQASYYFRVVEQSNQPEVIKAIVDLGHEIGYHYEDMTACHGDTEKAIAHFNEWLSYFCQFYPVKTICMHGSPRSKFDGRDLWKQYDYHKFGIIGEPYFDVDFSKIFYLTDTGRRWDGFNVSIRDKVPIYQDEWVKKALVYHSTNDVIRAIGNGTFPMQLMMTTHPQRWTDKTLAWFKELCMQLAKNLVKKCMLQLG